MDVAIAPAHAIPKRAKGDSIYCNTSVESAISCKQSSTHCDTVGFFSDSVNPSTSYPYEGNTPFKPRSVAIAIISWTIRKVPNAIDFSSVDLLLGVPLGRLVVRFFDLQ